MAEVWADLVGFETKYEISDKGNVKSKVREVLSMDNNTRAVGGNLIQSKSMKSGKPHFIIKAMNRRIHIDRACAVAQAFLGKPPDGAIVGYVDGDVNNVKSSNLFWSVQESVAE